MLLHLLGNFAVVGFFVSVWCNLQDWAIARRPLTSKLALGLLMGIASIAAMNFSWQLGTGSYFDLRSVSVALATLYGGPMGGAVAGTVTLAYRGYLGGSGLLSGSLGIAIAFVIGLLGNHYTRSRHWQSAPMLLIGLMLSCCPLFTIKLLPEDVASTLLPTEIAILSVVTFVAFTISNYSIFRNQRLARNRALLIAAIEQAPEYFYIKDVNCQFVAANRNTININEISEGETLIGKTDLDLENSSRSQTLIDEERLVLKSGRSLNGKLEQIPSKDGSEKYYSTSKSAVTLANGEIVGLVGVTKDVTALKQAEQAIEDGRTRLDFVLKEMSEGIALIRHDGFFLLTNDRYRELFPKTGPFRVGGAYFPDILELSIETGEQPDLLGMDQASWIRSIMQRLQVGGEEIIELSGGRWLQIRTRPSAKGISTIVCSDISETKMEELKLRTSVRQFELLARTDSLTGLFNRREFDRILAEKFHETENSERVVSVMLIDVDYFKKFNDDLGQLAGDEVIQLIGKTIGNIAEGMASVTARFGGQEFGLLFSNFSVQQVNALGESVRTAVNSLNIAHPSHPNKAVTVSVGIAHMNGQKYIKNSHQLLHDADRALRKAKAHGRDRCISAAA